MNLHTKKQKQYFEEVIRLHYEKGYGADRISRILPTGHAAASRWIAVFASGTGKKSVQMHKSNPQKQPSTSDPQRNDVQSLQAEIFRLQAQLKDEQLRADAYDVLLKVAREEFVLQYIHSIRKKDPGIGGMKLWYMYRKAFCGNSPAGRDRFEDIVDKYGLRVRTRVRKPGTTDSTHGLPVYPNPVRDFIHLEPNQLWVSDITCITIRLDEYTYIFCCLSMIPDACTEEIVGWSVGPTPATIHPVESLTKALKRIEVQKHIHLIHHPDRGCQYASNEYVSLLNQYGIHISMTEGGDPKDNARAERINNTMKNELLKGMVFHRIEEVKTAVTVAVEFYNHERPHMSIDMMTPEEAAACTGETDKRWTGYRLIAIKNRMDGLENAEKGLPLPALSWVSFRATPSSQLLTAIRLNE